MNFSIITISYSKSMVAYVNNIDNNEKTSPVLEDSIWIITIIISL